MTGRYQAIFRSRWRALMWAGGVLLTAYCSIPSEGEQPGEAAAVQALLGQGSAQNSTPHKHVNPWAKDAEEAH